MLENESLNLSIVTVVFNGEKTIEFSINSLRQQSYKQIEHVIQDGGSTDNTIKIIERNKLKNTIIRSGSDCGIYDALNKGISATSGDIIGILHADDFYSSEDVLSKVMKVFEDPTVDGVYGDLKYVSATNPDQIIRTWTAGHFVHSDLKYGWMPPHPTVFLRKEVFASWGLYDSSMQISADYEALLRYITVAKLNFHYIPETLVLMRVGGVSNAKFSNILKKMYEDYTALRRYNVGGILSLLCKNVRKLNQFLKK